MGSASAAPSCIGRIQPQALVIGHPTGIGVSSSASRTVGLWPISCRSRDQRRADTQIAADAQHEQPLSVLRDASAPALCRRPERSSRTSGPPRYRGRPPAARRGRLSPVAARAADRRPGNVRRPGRGCSSARKRATSRRLPGRGRRRWSNVEQSCKGARQAAGHTPLRGRRGRSRPPQRCAGLDCAAGLACPLAASVGPHHTYSCCRLCAEVEATAAGEHRHGCQSTSAYATAVGGRTSAERSQVARRNNSDGLRFHLPAGGALDFGETGRVLELDGRGAVDLGTPSESPTLTPTSD